MISNSIISQNNQIVSNQQPTLVWESANNGNYTNISPEKTNIFVPVTANVNTYNHHPFIIEFNGSVYAMFTTTNANEENPGEFIRWSRSTDGLLGRNWTTPAVLFESQDNLAKVLEDGGRVLVCSGFIILNGELYALSDVNDRGKAVFPNERSRDGIGILIRKININDTLDTIYWIENKNGTLIAPTAISGYPSYTFDNTLRNYVREYFINNPEKRPDWYYGVANSDILYTGMFYGTGSLAEPRIAKMPSGVLLKLWRDVGVLDGSRKYAQISDYGYIWNTLYRTNIPDSPSRTSFFSLKNGVLVIIGNNEGSTRDPLFVSFSQDGIAYKSGNTYNIDNETTGASFAGQGKGTGVQYPHSVELSNGKIACIYSVNKEKIRIAFFNVPVLV